MYFTLSSFISVFFTAYANKSFTLKEFQSLLDREARRLADLVYKRHGKVVNLKDYDNSYFKKANGSRNSGYRDGFVDRRNGKRPSYHQGQNDAEDAQKKRKSENEWRTVEGKRNRGLKAGNGHTKQDDNYDFYEDTQGVSSANRYNMLRSDLVMSDDGYAHSD